MKTLIKTSLIAMLGLASTSLVHADIAQTYNKSCATCHDSGALNAPKKGDSATWQKLTEQKGQAALVKAAHDGKHQMPAMGLCQSCSDEDLANLIDYMSK